MRTRLPAIGLGVVGLVLSAALAFTAMLPSGCGQVGRPDVDFAARATMVIAGLALIGSGLTLLRARRGHYASGVLAAVAGVELCALAALVVFYEHRTAWFDHCG